ncbi:unnamed protein product [Brassica oleracea var. botrytis]
MSRTWMIHPLLAKQRCCLVDHARDDQVDYKDRRNTNDQSKSERLAMRIAVRKAKKTIKKEAITTWTIHPLLAKHRRCLVITREMIESITRITVTPTIKAKPNAVQ